VVLIALALLAAGGGSAQAASSALPTSERTGTLTIHTFVAEHYLNLREGTGSPSDLARVPVSADALTGVRFTLEKLLVADKTAPRLDSPLDPGFTVRTGTTDKDGQWRVTDLPVGFYRVTEEVPDGTEALNERFLVKMPLELLTDDGPVWNWDVHLFPKHLTKDTVVDPLPKRIVIIKESTRDGARLSGAVFKIATSERYARQGVFVTHDGADIEVATDSEGKATIEVLRATTYYLVETKAPAGFQQLRDPIKVTVSDASAQPTVTVTVPNQPVPSGIAAFVPKTGESMLLSLALLLLIALLGTLVSMVATRSRARYRG